MRSLSVVLGRFLSSVLPKTPSGRRFAAGAAIDSLGNGMFLAASTLYFVTVAGFPAARVGAVLSIAGIAGLVSPVPFGRLADSIGPLKVYVGLLVARGAGYAGFAVVGSFWPYAVLTCVLTALDQGCSPLQQVVVGHIEGGRNQTRTMASIRSVRNIGLTGGFLMAGLVLAIRHRLAFQALFLGNALSFVVIAILVAGTRHHNAAIGVPTGTPECAHADGHASAAPARIRSPFRDYRFMLFTVSNGVLSLHDSVLFVLLPLWVARASHAPSFLVSALLAVNTVLTVLLQVRVSRFAATPSHALRLIWAALLPLLFACGMFAVAERVPIWAAIACAVIAVALLTAGENLHSAAVWQLSYELSPPSARARYLSTFSLGVNGQQILGPVLVTAVMLPLGDVGWLLLASLFALAAVGVRATGDPRDAPGSIPPLPAPESSKASS